MPSTLADEPSMTPDRPALTSLPLDLILDIADQLPASSVACLSLTCKSLYYSQPLRHIWTQGLETPPSRYLNTDNPFYPGISNRNCDYFDLITTLRKDMPTYLDCDFCQKFHPKPTPKASRPGMEWVSCPTAPEKGMCVSWPKFGVHLQFQDMQMVMNQHRLGGLHGAPLSSIALSTDWNIIRNDRDAPFLCKLSLEAEIVNGSLMVHATQRLFFTQRQTTLRCKNLINIVRDSSSAFKVCKHRCQSNRCLVEKLGQLFAGNLSNYIEPAYRQKRTELQRCSDCHTCYCLEATYHRNWYTSMDPESHDWNIPADSIELTLHTWMLLGRCEHTFSPLWLNVSEQLGANAPIYPEHTMLKAKKIASEIFQRVMLTKVQTQYSQMSWCFDAIHHPSLLPAIDRAVALENDPFAAKHHELTKILTAARHRVHKLDMRNLVDVALGVRPGTWDSCLRAYYFHDAESLRIGVRILKEHERNNAPPGSLQRFRAKVWAGLSGVFS